MRYREMLAAAKAAGACGKALDALKKYTSLAKAITDPCAPEWAGWYAHFVIKGRWPEAETVIATDPKWAYRYAHDAIKGRWPEAEAVIMTSPGCAYQYACFVIVGRWPEAEAVIMTDLYWMRLYKQLTKC